MKVYEYLAAGLPIVATPLPALANVPEVATAPDAKGIAELIERAPSQTAPSAEPSARVRLLCTHGSGGWRRSPRQWRRCNSAGPEGQRSAKAKRRRARPLTSSKLLESGGISLSRTDSNSSCACS